MKVLIIGSGGREHALAWKLKTIPTLYAVVVRAGKRGDR